MTPERSSGTEHYAVPSTKQAHTFAMPIVGEAWQVGVLASWWSEEVDASA